MSSFISAEDRSVKTAPITREAVADVIVSHVQLFFAQWGWPLVFAAVAVLLARPHVQRWLRRRRDKATQRPERVAVLSEDLRRVRQRQQKDYLKANEW